MKDVEYFMNEFIYSDNEKRYHTLAYHYKMTGGRVFKAAVNCGFTCPNIDGTCGMGGCIYCLEGSRLFTNDSALSVTEQLTSERERIHAKYPDAALCAYFQTNTNTYAPVEKLRMLYEEAESFDGVKSISVATRPDCLPDDVLDLLTELNGRIPVTVELGLQTVHDKTADLINRGYHYPVFESAYNNLKTRGIRTCVHLIDGLPGESRDEMLKSAEVVGRLVPDALKIHLLYVAEGTRLADLYENGLYTPMTLEEYTSVVVSQLEYIPAQTVIERVTGDGDKKTLLAPRWSMDKIRVLGTIDKIFAERDTYQGKKCFIFNNN